MKPLRAYLVVTSMFVLSASVLHAQQGATVSCRDGTKSAGGRGACSSHGGIAPMAKASVKADAKTDRAEKKAERAEKKADRKADKMEKAAEKAADKSAMKDEEKEAKGATAECKDHTYSHAKTHQGACSRHGGVAKFLDAK